VDPAYQQQILEMLKQTQRSEMVVGWYHSHPSFGCWLSNVDINTQQSFERLNPKTVAVVLDPIQSVRGKVVIDAFRLIDTVTLSTGAEARQTTSNLGYLNKPSMEAVFKGLNRYYYSINISYRSNELEQKMLLNLYKNKWSKCLKLEDPGKAGESVSAGITKCAKLGVDFQKRIEEEVSKSESELKIKNTGKLDPKRHTQEEVTSILKQSLLGIINNMISTAAF
jgi:26S proteasome regulatory subunit N11